MKKSILIIAAAIVVAAIATVNVTLSNSKTQNLSVLLLKNIEALADNEYTSNLWVRTDTDCDYEFTGLAESYIMVTIGDSFIQLQLDKDGKATYTVKNGQTDCTADGKQQCIAQYCASI